MTVQEMLDYMDKGEEKCRSVDVVDNRLYDQFGVKRGLRDLDGHGVLTGVTNISKVLSSKIIDGKEVFCDGELWYRGYNVMEMVKDFGFKRFGFEEIAYLLLFGELPDKTQLADFRTVLGKLNRLPTNFTRDVIMKAPSRDIMNSMTKSVLTLASYDDFEVSDLSIPNVLRQCMALISEFPMLAVYGYCAYNHYEKDDSMYIHRPNPKLSTSENLLRMLRPDKSYTKLEAQVLDAALVLHMEHGGGNNSTFTNVVMGSTGTDLYSAVCGSIGSLKGPKHGGANISVNKMMQQIIADTHYSCDEALLRSIVDRILDKDYYDNSGLIYGFGHAVYTLSDPRCELLRSLCKTLAEEQGCSERYRFYSKFESVVKEAVLEHRGKPICTNVDYYSGFAYAMLGIPEDLFTPLFAIARVAGWVAHNVENKMYDGKIMRPATKYIGDHQKYVPMKKR